jgi:pyruvate-formate lyase
MSTQITITLPDEVYQRAERFARLANRDIASVLADTIQLSIPAISPEAAALEPISTLSDEQVIALTQLQMEPEQDARLSDLLDRQQSGILTETERKELQTLMQIYQEGLLRKATALSEAVKRGLMEPLSS